MSQSTAGWMAAWGALAFGCASTPSPAVEPPPILVVIAPAPAAPSGLQPVSARAMPSDELAVEWAGSRDGDNDHRFTYRLHVEPKGKDKRDVEGWFEFTLAQAPDSSRLRDRIGESGREYVRGRYDPTTRELTLRGYRVDAPGFLSTDEYRIQISPGGRGFEGRTRGSSYRWESMIRGRATRN